MKSCYCWIYLLILFRNISADSTLPPRYIVYYTQVSFDQAVEDCSPGVLTTLATDQEVVDILEVISKSASPPHQNEFTFWIGLRKEKNQCVVPTLPLRGFKWTEDGSEDSQVSHWTEEPKHTCTTVRCAALKGMLDGSMVTRWGLIPVTCKKNYQFICKLKDKEARVKPATTEPASPEPKPATLEPPKPTNQGPKPETDLKPKTGPELQEPDPDSGSEPAPGSDSCQHPLIPSARSISLDRDNSSRIQVECWSSDQLELHCSGHPAMWRLQDNSPANFTTICLMCASGFQKDASGNCVDIDECSGPLCRHTCLNTEGSYNCFCSDENGKHHNEDSPVCAGVATNSILILVLVVVAALVLLVVVIAVTVKCCLMRRSKKRAMMKAEKIAMKSKDGKDSFETADEKAGT